MKKNYFILHFIRCLTIMRFHSLTPDPYVHLNRIFSYTLISRIIVSQISYITLYLPRILQSSPDTTAVQVVRPTFAV